MDWEWEVGQEHCQSKKKKEEEIDSKQVETMKHIPNFIARRILFLKIIIQ